MNVWRLSTALRGLMCARYRLLRPSRMLSSKDVDVDGEARILEVTRIYSDENGESKFGSFKIRMRGSGDIGYLSNQIGCTGMIARYTPGDYNFSWHNAPRRQFIVNLDADVEVEVSVGEKRVIKQGEVFFVEDTIGKGHFSRAVGSEPRHSLFFSVPDDFVAEDC